WSELDAADGPRLRAWMNAWVETRTPDGESFADVAARVAKWAAELPGESSIAVVAHAGSIRALLCTALGLPLEAAFRLRIDHARVSALRLQPHGAELLYLNAEAPAEG
ncbi:histidine phosphatase family protein, partial [Longimicrobium sp.]|uniref:histidine phosphatase family protein n=1 Tax=Longimicrobium sp. TaxID=2029185 RepID=UPI002E37310E